MDPNLYRAATSGDVAFMDRVANAANRTQLLLSKAPQQNTALHIASSFGHAQFTRKILELCGELRWMKTSEDDTALHWAARAGCWEIVEILLDYNLTGHVEEGRSRVGLLRMQNKEGDTALHEVVRKRRKDVAIKMVQAYPKLAGMVNNAQESSFLLSAKEGMEEVVKEILSPDSSGHSGQQSAAAISNSSGMLFVFCPS